MLSAGVTLTAPVEASSTERPPERFDHTLGSTRQVMELPSVAALGLDTMVMTESAIPSRRPCATRSEAPERRFFVAVLVSGVGPASEPIRRRAASNIHPIWALPNPVR